MKFYHDRLNRRNRILKFINDYGGFRGKTIFQKLFYFLSVNEIEEMFYDFTKNNYGPYSEALEEDLSILCEEGLIKIEKSNGTEYIIPIKEKIDLYFEDNEISITTSRRSDLMEINIMNLFENILKTRERIELAATIHYQTLMEKNPIKEQIFKKVEIWKPRKFSKNQKEEIWKILKYNKLIDEEIIKLNDYVDELKSLNPGPDDAHKFHRLVSRIIAYLFSNQLKFLKLEDNINFGRKRIDISTFNISKNGFFFNLYSLHKIHCPYIIFECKNLSYDLDNKAFDQIGMQLSDDIGKFGIIVCREIKNEIKMMHTIKDILSKQKKFVIFIEDKDIIEMLLAKFNKKKPDEILRSKLKELLF